MTRSGGQKKLATIQCHYYRKFSIKRRGAYSKLDFFDATLNREQRLFKNKGFQTKIFLSVKKSTNIYIELVVLGKLVRCTKQLRQANIIYHELMEKKTKYSHFEINKICFDEK